MMVHKVTRAATALTLLGVLAACGSSNDVGEMMARSDSSEYVALPPIGTDNRSSTIWDLFTNIEPPNTTVEVNRYLWNAALEVLDFLPVQTVDPFSGVIVTGFGTPPGGGQSYRAAVLVNDPAMDARSLKVALMTRSGPASAGTIRAVEDAILTRARQLRVRDGRL